MAELPNMPKDLGKSPGPEPTALEAADELEALRRLLLAPQQQELERVRRDLDTLQTRLTLLQNVSEILPEAILASARRDGNLARALAPTIETTLSHAIRRDPQGFAEVLVPVIGPAIRRSVRDALRSFVETTNRLLEHSLSPRSLGWRLEAMRTGRSFAEVLLSHTLHYRVEQIFLIDRQAGLPLQHVIADAVPDPDAALTSGMLAALQDFARESLGADDAADLESLEVGDLVVWTANSPHALVAAVIRGLPDAAYRDVLHDLAETIHLQFGEELQAFDGDAAPFERAVPLLETGLVAHYREQSKGPSPLPWLAAVAVVIFGIWAFMGWQENRRWEAALALLTAEPGLLITGDGEDGGRRYVQGLRDPRSADPTALLANAGFSDVTTRWTPFQSLEPELEQADTDAGRVADLIAYAESQALRFGTGATAGSLLPGQDATLAALADSLAQLLAVSGDAGRDVRFRILGHASPDGGDATNLQLSTARAEAVRQQLLQRGLPADRLEAVGTGQPAPEGLYARSVLLEVIR